MLPRRNADRDRFCPEKWPMTVQSTRAQRVSAPTGSVEFDADVLVIGGGPAGTWAAISAAEQGARVVLADKGFCGTSGATAAAGTGVWYVDPEPALREAAMANREKLGGHLQDRRWMARVLDRTYEQSNRLADWGYPYPVRSEERRVGKECRSRWSPYH